MSWDFFCTYSMSCEMESVTDWIDDFPPIFFFCWIAKNHTSKTQQKVFSSTIKRADRTQIRKNGFCVHNSQLHSAFYFSIEFRKIYSWFKIKWVQRITLYPSICLWWVLDYQDDLIQEKFPNNWRWSFSKKKSQYIVL